ncbi:hypothetical protein PVK06_047857 [Gossypium arboreum]|uniref:Uncharacterized protein n=1 Tax=Gossypium arboreum TaxID=29729 RepID=A0ABR0MED8_GOSAR|nr:hypothetical protein PVK06_047857 [Gossypium arboreum]
MANSADSTAVDHGNPILFGIRSCTHLHCQILQHRQFDGEYGGSSSSTLAFSGRAGQGSREGGLGDGWYSPVHGGSFGFTGSKQPLGNIMAVPMEFPFGTVWRGHLSTISNMFATRVPKPLFQFSNESNQGQMDGVVYDDPGPRYECVVLHLGTHVPRDSGAQFRHELSHVSG